MKNVEKVRFNSAHSVLWYLEKNTSPKKPEWRSLITSFLYNLYDIANKNYGLDINLKLVDGIHILYREKLLCFMHIRQKHILLHLHQKSLLYNHSITKKFKIKHSGSWPQMFKLTTDEELEVLLKYFRKLKVVNRKEYFKTRRISAKIQEFVYDRDKGKCARCGSSIDLHFDHIIPYSKGGSSDDVKNIQILCAKCNLQKGNRKFV
ncbi:MAG: HNH endonuclease [Chitinophagaceae bacterium]|nr:HNH endonuclease [Chitinophagaceae bacterium]